MKKFKYRILNLSEVALKIKADKAMNLISVFDELGNDGWELVFKLTDSSFLFKKEI